LSKTGVNVVPELVVFQTPPEAAATKYRLRSLGSTAKSTTRPEVKAGPIERSRSPANVPLDIGSGFFASAGFSSCATIEREDKAIANTKQASINRRFEVNVRSSIRTKKRQGSGTAPEPNEAGVAQP
jgi:hypothetical protein